MTVKHCHAKEIITNVGPYKNGHHLLPYDLFAANELRDLLTLTFELLGTLENITCKSCQRQEDPQGIRGLNTSSWCKNQVF